MSGNICNTLQHLFPGCMSADAAHFAAHHDNSEHQQITGETHTSVTSSKAVPRLARNLCSCLQIQAVNERSDADDAIHMLGKRRYAERERECQVLHTHRSVCATLDSQACTSDRLFLLMLQQDLRVCGCNGHSARPSMAICSVAFSFC